MNESQKVRQLKILRRFIGVFCREKNHQRQGELCDNCLRLWTYASQRLENCPFDPKPKCKDCTTHCYAPEYRRQIQEVMKFSGMHFVKRGRLDWMVRYFLSK